MTALRKTRTLDRTESYPSAVRSSQLPALIQHLRSKRALITITEVSNLYIVRLDGREFAVGGMGQGGGYGVLTIGAGILPGKRFHRLEQATAAAVMALAERLGYGSAALMAVETLMP